MFGNSKQLEAENETLKSEVERLENELQKALKKAKENREKYEECYYENFNESISKTEHQNAINALKSEHENALNQARNEYQKLYDASKQVGTMYAEKEKLATDLQNRLNRSRQECNRLKKTRAKLENLLAS